MFVLMYSKFILAHRNSPLPLPSSALGIDHNQERVGTRQRVDLKTGHRYSSESIRQDWWEQQVGGWHTCSAWPSPRVNLKVWLASSGLVLGGDSPSPRFSIDWRSCKHKRCLHFSTRHKMSSCNKTKLYTRTNTHKKTFTFTQDTWFSSICEAAMLWTAFCICRRLLHNWPMSSVLINTLLLKRWRVCYMQLTAVS